MGFEGGVSASHQLRRVVSVVLCVSEILGHMQWDRLLPFALRRLETHWLKELVVAIVGAMY